MSNTRRMLRHVHETLQVKISLMQQQGRAGENVLVSSGIELIFFPIAAVFCSKKKVLINTYAPPEPAGLYDKVICRKFIQNKLKCCFKVKLQI